MKKSILRVVLWIIIASFMLTVVASCDFRGEQGSQGEKGESGEAGNGIISISKTATDGLIDTYTITYTNGETTTFTVTNGKEGAAGKDVADIHNNVYNVTATPSFSTNENAFLESTNDTTDRTADIAAVLASTGYCQLGPGVFYVTNLHMPANSTLCGSGSSTRLILPNNVTEGYAVRVNNCCTVRDLRITSPTAISLSENVGERHGIMFCGTYDEDKNPGGIFISISNVYIDNFTGGGITCRNTGYSTTASINASNITIRNCNVGINISYWSEYHRFTNITCHNCYYGCINNGGNNMFVNCAFNSNKVGFVIDNSSGDMPNNAHGSAVGCTFNHMDNNEGYSIKIYNTNNGFVFEGCQIFYGKTLIDQSSGIVFTGCNYGRGEGIEVNKGGTVLFNGCLFGSAPKVTITDNKYTHFVECYLRSGEKI